jgi:hypothetical protein
MALVSSRKSLGVGIDTTILAFLVIHHREQAIDMKWVFAFKQETLYGSMSHSNVVTGLVSIFFVCDLKG